MHTKANSPLNNKQLNFIIKDIDNTRRTKIILSHSCFTFTQKHDI